jgi:hypothetical protein
MANKRPAVTQALDPGWRERAKLKDLPPVVRVTWMDACSWNGLLDPSEGWEKRYPNGSIQQSVGYKLKADEKFITVAQDISTGNHGARNLMDIPTALVLEVKEYR